MTDQATDTAAATTATPAPDGAGGNNTQDTSTQQRPSVMDNGGTDNGGTDNGTDTTNTTAATDFALPDEYKDKPWAAKIKSQDDVYKQLDNLNGLVGKKTIQPIDYETATPEQIAEYYSKTAPEDVSKYDFGEGDADFQKAVGGVFKEFGINEHQASGIASKIGELAKGMATDKATDDRSADGYMAIMKESFGDDHEKAVGLVENLLKSNLDDKDKGFMDDLDNTTKGAVDRAVYKVANDYEDRIKAILDEHGIKETSAHVNGGAKNPSTDIRETQKVLRQQIRDLDARPHSAQEKQELVDKLNATYKTA